MGPGPPTRFGGVGKTDETHQHRAWGSNATPMRKLETPAAPSRASPEAKRTVLYVEDENENFELTELRLGQRYALVRARTAVEAVEQVKATPGLYAVLMDIQLHGSELDGLQLTRLLRGTVPEGERPAWAQGLEPLKVPILFVTAYGNRYTEAELVAAGGDLAITKPVDFLKLTLALANVNSRKVAALLPPPPGMPR